MNRLTYQFTPKVTAWIRTGRPFGPMTQGGSAPAGVVATEDRVFVSNAHDDSITVIDAHTNQLVWRGYDSDTLNTNNADKTLDKAVDSVMTKFFHDVKEHHG